MQRVELPRLAMSHDSTSFYPEICGQPRLLSSFRTLLCHYAACIFFTVFSDIMRSAINDIQENDISSQFSIPTMTKTGSEFQISRDQVFEERKNEI